MHTQVADISTNKNKGLALLITLLFHAGLIALLILSVLETPDPPLSGGEGMVVNLGYVDESTGDIQPVSDEAVEQEPIITQKQLAASEVVQEKVVTQNIEETVKLNTTEKENVKTNPTNEEVTKTEENTQQSVQPTVNPVAIYKGKKNNSTSDGNAGKGSGDQGDPNGDPYSKNYGKNTGNGNGPGSGDGTGSGDGPGKNGIVHTLTGRKAQILSKPNYECDATGNVVVEIIVDQKGNVIRATAGKRGSTTESSCLYNKAREAALRTKFNANPDAPEEQKGTIVYNFSLK